MTQPVNPRPLSAEEKALADFLLSAEFPGRDELRVQLDSVKVVGICECGCGTVELAVEGDVPRSVCREPIPIEAHDDALDVLLFVRDGVLSSLEIVDYKDRRPLPYPRPSDLELWPRPPSKP